MASAMDFASTSNQAVCTGVGEISGSSGCDSTSSSSTSLDSTLKLVLNILSVIVGIIAVIMIIVGGIKYITSGGSSDKTSSAKDTIMYAIIGLVIVAVAQIIVTFVLSKVSTV
ncbi:MAG TPA: TrbC/VirB2 family protein [Candidatus Saccharimonadia bacterium]|nr:TrbC/VirB2 family protein [Candidatus Saccharimonadia bacterium]